MRVVKIVADGMYNYEEVGTLVITNDKMVQEYLQMDVDNIIADFEDSNSDYYISDIVEELNNIGYGCEFFPDNYIEEITI